jgi:hypothetical protein
MNTDKCKIRLLLFFLFLQCSSEPKSSIVFKVFAEKNKEGNEVRLAFTFASNKEATLLFNWDALSVFDPTFEKDGILQNKEPLEKLIDSISNTQFVIENESHENRFFSDIQLFEGEQMDVKNVFALEPKIDTVKINVNHVVNLKSEPINSNRLKINLTDSLIRLRYLFKPTSEQQAAGFKPYILTSNWFKL